MQSPLKKVCTGFETIEEEYDTLSKFDMPLAFKLVSYMSPLSYYCLMLASKSFYTLMKDKLPILGYFYIHLRRRLFGLIPGKPEEKEQKYNILMRHLFEGSDLHLCGGFLLSVLHDEPDHFTDVDFVRTGFERDDIPDDKLMIYFQSIEKKTPVEVHYDGILIQAIYDIEKLQFIYYECYKQSIPTFHFEFCRVSFGKGGRFCFNGCFNQVVTKSCKVDLTRAFFSPHIFPISSEQKAFACLTKYEKRGYTIRVLPMPAAEKFDNRCSKRSNFLESQGMLFNRKDFANDKDRAALIQYYDETMKTIELNFSILKNKPE